MKLIFLFLGIFYAHISLALDPVYDLFQKIDLDTNLKANGYTFDSSQISVCSDPFQGSDCKKVSLHDDYKIETSDPFDFSMWWIWPLGVDMCTTVQLKKDGQNYCIASVETYAAYDSCWTHSIVLINNTFLSNDHPCSWPDTCHEKGISLVPQADGNVNEAYVKLT